MKTHPCVISPNRNLCICDHISCNIYHQSNLHNNNNNNNNNNNKNNNVLLHNAISSIAQVQNLSIRGVSIHRLVFSCGESR